MYDTTTFTATSCRPTETQGTSTQGTRVCMREELQRDSVNNYYNRTGEQTEEQWVRPLPGYKVTREQCGDTLEPDMYHNTHTTTLT